MKAPATPESPLVQRFFEAGSEEARRMDAETRKHAAAGKSGREFGDDYPRLGTKPKVRAVVEPEPVIEAKPEPVVIEPAPLSQSEREELEALRAQRDAAPVHEPLQFMPLPEEDEKLSDYGDVGEEATGDPGPVDVTEALPDEPDRAALLRLSRKYKQRINFLNNKSLDQTIEDDERKELAALYERYHELAERGIRS